MAEPYWSDGEDVTLHLGDCLAVLPGLPDCSVDAIVTDPPYALGFMGKTWDSPGAFVERPANRDHRWDHVGGNHNPVDSADAARTRRVEGLRFQAWCEQWARECLRVLKPGGWLLAFGGTRTSHRLVCGIEDAGFEVRDSVADLTGYDAPGLMWVYGSGFPKSLDVSKAIDKRGGNDGAWFADWLASRRTESGLSRNDVSSHFPSKTGGVTGKVWNWEHGHGIPTQEEFDRLCDLLGTPRLAVFEAEREVIAERRGITSGYGPGDMRVPNPRPPLSAAATDEAARWEGWGTALKPGWEPIAVARKPLAGTVARNVLEYGTGALNVDGCRVEGPAGNGHWVRNGEMGTRGIYGQGGQAGEDFGSQNPAAGRWPPNVVLGEEAAAELDRQSGVLTSGANPARRGSDKFRDAYGEFAGQEECAVHRGVDSGGASRFFPVFRYEAKAAASERPRLPDGTAHPTVKPVGLMAWLVRLVTPPGGLVLDPFAGSGATAEACIVEGFRCVLVEQDPASAELIKARLSKPIQPAMFGEIA